VSGPDLRFLTRKWPPAIGGMETYCARLTEEMAVRMRVETLALSGQADGRPPAVAAQLWFGLRTALLLSVRPAAKVTHVGDMAAWPLGLAAKIARPRTRLVLSAHGSDVAHPSPAYRAYLRLGGALLGRTGLVLANSRFIAERARRAGFRRIEVVPLGTDLSSASQGPRDRLLYAGRISRAKGLRFLVEQVLPLLPGEQRLRVAGSLWDASERPLLDHPRVDYAGALEPAALAEEYGRAAAVLVPTRVWEGFGLVAIEAAACGAPVIAADHSGLAEIVRPPIGVTVPADDPAAWAEAIGAMLSRSEAQQRAQSEAAAALVEQRFRWSAVADATAAAYRRA
jgi:phosphatidyl-myo-inositol dimannoside synthase